MRIVGGCPDPRAVLDPLVMMTSATLPERPDSIIETLVGKLGGVKARDRRHA
jgi:hypothetical protein